MIVVMKPDAHKEHVDHVVSLVRDFGLKEHVIHGTDRVVIACIGDKRMVEKEALESAAFVEKVVPILAPFKMASREVKKQGTIVEIGPRSFPVGGRKVGVIAGPCAVENEEMLIRIAEKVKEAGGIGLRGGAFKPRSSPYSFQGHGEEGLKMLAEARKRTGLAIVTEVVSVDTVELVAEYADVLQIGARNMQHFPLLEAVGKLDKPIMLKRGMSATLDEFLLAAEYIINAGNTQVILCERGIRTFESYVRNTLPIAAVPALKAQTHLPVIVDPSHAAGHAYLVPALCNASIAAGADGLMVECHDDPEHAFSDGAQCVTPPMLKAIMEQLSLIAGAIDREV